MSEANMTVVVVVNLASAEAVAEAAVAFPEEEGEVTCAACGYGEGCVELYLDTRADSPAVGAEAARKFAQDFFDGPSGFIGARAYVRDVHLHREDGRDVTRLFGDFDCVVHWDGRHYWTTVLHNDTWVNAIGDTLEELRESLDRNIELAEEDP